MSIERIYGPIVDSHIHVGVSDILPWSITSTGLRSFMRENGITKSIAIPTIYADASMNDTNRMVLSDLCGMENVYPALFVDPHQPLESFELLQGNDTYRAIKFHPSFAQATILVDYMRRFFDYAAVKRLPVIVHCGRNPLSNIEPLLIAAKENPRTMFVAAHLGGMVADKVCCSLKKMARSGLTNIYTDISGVQRINLIEQAVRLLGANRVMFGSDEPFCDIQLQFHAMKLADLSMDEAAMVAGGTAEELYGI